MLNNLAFVLWEVYEKSLQKESFSETTGEEDEVKETKLFVYRKGLEKGQQRSASY